MSAVSPVRPRDGYALRVHHLLGELGRRWSIALLAPGEGGEVAGVAQWWTLPPRTSVVRATPPFEAGDLALAAELRRAAADWRPAALLLWPGTEHAALALPDLPPLVVDRIDSSSLTLWRTLPVLRGARARLGALRELCGSLRYERSLVRAAAATVAVGSDDARWLAALGRRAIDVVPNGVVTAEPGRAADEAPRPTVAFTGVLSYEPNVTAARVLATRIWPRVRAAIPEAELWIAGRAPSAEVRGLAACPGILVRPDIPDLAQLLREAWLAVAPMQSGAGIKNKILEAWAVARPVVMSPLAANGLELDAELADCVAAEPEAIADKVVQLLRSAELRRRTGEHARALAVRQHSWSRAAERLSERLCAVTLAHEVHGRE